MKGRHTYVRNDTVAYHHVGVKDLNLATPKIPNRTNYLMCPVLPQTDALGDSQCPWEWLEVPVAFHGAWAHQDMMVRPGRAIMKLTFKPTPHHPIPGFSASTAPSQELGNCISQVTFTPMRWCHVWIKAILCRRLLEPSHETCGPYMSLQEVSMCTQYRMHWGCPNSFEFLYTTHTLSATVWIHVYSGTSLHWTSLGPSWLSCKERCP